ncbi:DUF2254 domain-containing protein [Tamlana sp. I1]|uniref:DUF2254 domain-containing protein n=1 Tax=Tamlana sp. I1 TaxID=2762061 RepID=UPI00188F3BFB|nr:DUF2254 domain-containing protein [Tamlana sp. I1]
MKTILKLIKSSYNKILQSIAFYPVLISFLFIILTYASIRLENLELISSLKKSIPFLFINDYETARSILSTLIGGILSLTVFSFTMVMVVLNQASSNFSPRLLPSLISNKKHQIILGIYIGTLLYCILILIALGANGVDTNSLGLSAMLAALFGVFCTALFVYFIHNISTAVQIHNIIDKIHKKSNQYIRQELEHQKETKKLIKSIKHEDWHTINNEKTGYFRAFDTALFDNDADQPTLEIAVIPYMNEHVWEGDPIIKSKNKLSDDTVKNLLFSLYISTDRHEGEKGIGGMIKLMEIAVKAMSPGINDPGTAIDALIKLGRLLHTSLEYADATSEVIKDKNLTIYRNNVCADELMRLLIQPIRYYSKNDSSVIYELIQVLQFLEKNPNISLENRMVIQKEIEATLSDFEKNCSSLLDKQRMRSMIEKRK